MGDRGQVYVKDNKVYLYTHWGASALANDVETAIAKKWRWNDPDYLTRIIFDVMTRGSHDEETGYGIGTTRAGDIWRIVTVDCKEQTVTVADHGKRVSRKSFAEIAGIEPTITSKIGGD